MNSCLRRALVTASLVVTVWGLIIFNANEANAAPPANDNFANAVVVVSLPFSDSRDTTDATTELSEPRPCDIDKTVWYQFTPLIAGKYTIWTTGSSFVGNTALALYTGESLGQLTNISCRASYTDAGPAAVITFDATVGTAYRIQAGGYFDNSGTLVVNVRRAAPPPNDSFDASIFVGAIPFTNSTETLDAGLEANEPTQCGNIGRTVWYHYRPATTGRYTITTTSGSDFDTVLGVYTGDSLQSLVELACDDDTGGGRLSLISFAGVAGIAYRIQAGGYSGDFGNLVVNVTEDDDTDGDGVANTLDNCPAVANSGQEDRDRDGAGDACDDDDDNDGVPDTSDNCPFQSNSDQSDGDSDGVGTRCDNCPNAANQNQLDSDSDGFGDVCDNCPNTFGGQLDTDGDGQGNVCDPDDDNDGVADAPDNCDLIVNLDQANHDTDAFGDACDIDDDNDGFTDTTETTYGSDSIDAMSVPEQPAVNPGSCDDDKDNDKDGVKDDGEGPKCTLIKVIPDKGSEEGGGALNEVGGFTYQQIGFGGPGWQNLALGTDAIVMWSVRAPKEDLTPTQLNALLGYIRGGGKLIIYDTEAFGSFSAGAVDHSWLAELSMRTSVPRPTGANCVVPAGQTPPCRAAVTEVNSMVSYLPGTAYINAEDLAGNTDAIKDAAVMRALSRGWCVDMKGLNFAGEEGPIHAYGRLSDGTNTGLVIYNGLDADDMGEVQPDWLSTLLLNELKQPVNPDSLPCTEPVTQECYIDTDGNGLEDNDGDALCDDWETTGIDFNGDGNTDLQLPGADPNRADVYVEVDYMDMHAPDLSAIDDVVRAFDQGAYVVGNSSGINLHVLVDEILPHDDELTISTDNPDFDPCTKGVTPGVSDFNGPNAKGGHFGTAADRTSGNAANVLGAKRLVYHYAVFAHTLFDVDDPDPAFSEEDDDRSGCAELGGNDFVVALGRLPGGTNGHPGGTRDDQAGTFMHELGHNLGLQHGGGDDVNCKPNYPSVMSYSRQLNYLLPDRPLDYSRVLLPPLNEANLDEGSVLGGAGETVFGPPRAQRPVPAAPARTIQLADGTWVAASAFNEAIDWDMDGTPGETGNNVKVGNLSPDINNLGGEFPCTGVGGGGELIGILTSYNDWINLDFNFRDSVDFADGIHQTAGFTSEMSVHEAHALSPDDDGDNIGNLLDNCDTVPNPGQEDVDADFAGDPCDNCTTATNPDQANNDGDPQGDACDLDDDNDGGLDTMEAHSGTSQILACSTDSIAYNEDPDARLTDFNDDQSVTGADLSAMAASIGFGVPPAPVRKDIAPGTAGDNAITGADLSAVAAVIGTTCAAMMAAGGDAPSEGGQIPQGEDPSATIYAIDADPAGTIAGTVPQTYSADPNGNGTPEDNSLRAGTVDFCIQVPGPGNRQINVVGLNMGDAVAYDVRLLYDPGLVSISAVNHTPFVDNEGAAVGFINLPWDSSVSARMGAITANNNNGAGSAFFSATYSGDRSAGRSPDEPHLAATEPSFQYTAGSGGVPLVRLSVSLKAAAAGQVVNFDLTNSVAPGNDYVSLDPSGAEEVVPVPESNLLDGAIAVAPATCPLPPASSAAGGDVDASVVALPADYSMSSRARRSRIIS